MSHRIWRGKGGFIFQFQGVMMEKHPKYREYEDMLEEGASIEDYYPYAEMDLSCLDTSITDDRWSRSFAVTGSIDLDPDWF